MGCMRNGNGSFPLRSMLWVHGSKSALFVLALFDENLVNAGGQEDANS